MKTNDESEARGCRKAREREECATSFSSQIEVELCTSLRPLPPVIVGARSVEAREIERLKKEGRGKSKAERRALGRAIRAQQRLIRDGRRSFLIEWTPPEVSERPNVFWLGEHTTITGEALHRAVAEYTARASERASRANADGSHTHGFRLNLKH